MRALLPNRGLARDDDIGWLIYGFGGCLGEAGADAHGRLDTPQKWRAVDDDSEASALPGQGGAVVCDLGFDLCLLQNAGNLVADLAGL